MKTQSLFGSLAVLAGLCAFSTAGSAENERIVTTPPLAEKNAGVTPGAVPDVATAQWSDIKDYTFDQREKFFAGLKQLQARVDAQVDELTARRAAMTSQTDTKDWDFAMKEMGDSRSYLKGMAAEIAKATPETWDQEKDKVNQAWVRTQDAYDKVKSSTTSG